ncbi:MAG: sugar phosphate isomerase/epimerase family protein [Actinomycetota bacterium]
MKLSCGDHSFPLLRHDLALDLIAGLGFEGFDLALMGNRSHIRPEDVRHDVAGAAKRITAELDRRGLELSDVFVIPWTDFERFAPNSPVAQERQASRDLFDDMAALAARLNAPGITMVPGIDWPGLTHDQSLELAAEELQWRAARLSQEGMRFSVECHMGSVASTPDDVLRLLHLAPDLRLTLDYSHFIAPGHTQTDIDRLIPYASHVQVRGARPGRGQCGLEDNAIDFEDLVDQLDATGYDGFLTVEYVWINWEHMNECDNVSETIMLRDRLRAKLAHQPWTYTGSPT